MFLHWVGKRANYEQRNELDLNATGERIMVHRCCSGSLKKPRPLQEEASKINAHEHNHARGRERKIEQQEEKRKAGVPLGEQLVL